MQSQGGASKCKPVEVPLGGSRNRSSEDLHLAISEEVPSQAQVKSSGNKNCSVQEALHSNAITQYGDWVGVTEVTHLN